MFSLPISGVGVPLFVCAGRYLKCMFIIFIFYTIDNVVGPEILLIKNEFNFFNWGLGGPSFGLTHIYKYQIYLEISDIFRNIRYI